MHRLTTQELTEMTIRDLQRRKDRRQKGIDEATSFLIECGHARKKNARKSQKRGDRSFWIVGNKDVSKKDKKIN